jgi:hypothetical protein
VELLYKLSVPNNISNWKVFEEDERIINFLTNQDNFKDLAIDDEIFQEKLVETNPYVQKPEIDQSTDKPRSRMIPKGVSNLENLFDLRERFKGSMNTKTGSSCPMYKTINLGTPKNLKNINIDKTISKEERKTYLKLFREYQDVFAWSYRDMKTYDTRIIQYIIPLKPRVKPFQQNIQKYHPSLEPLMCQELKKLLDAKIIFQVRHFAWVANLVPVRKKSGEIRLCVDFRNLNRASENDNYPIPPMEQLLQIVFGFEIFSLLDDFSRYNQVLVLEEDHLKTTFRTKWGTFSYKPVPFGLINEGATFQRAMDVSFRGRINKCVVVYLDNVTMYSKNREDHIRHLTHIFERCMKYNISLNLEKTIFGVEEGKLPGHIIS